MKDYNYDCDSKDNDSLEIGILQSESSINIVRNGSNKKFPTINDSDQEITSPQVTIELTTERPRVVYDSNANEPGFTR